MGATVLTCSNCGAGIPRGASACEFCGSGILVPRNASYDGASSATCPACGTATTPGRPFCRECGADLLQWCPSCGASDPIGSQRCSWCGLSPLDARRYLQEKRVAEAKQKGWQRIAAAHVPLIELAVAPDEIVIMYWKEARLNCTERKSSAGLIVTDRAFLFLSLASIGWLGKKGNDVIKRVRFEVVKGLTVDIRTAELVISFPSGEGRASLPMDKSDEQLGKMGSESAWSMACRKKAEGIVYYFWPFLPQRLRSDW